MHETQSFASIYDKKYRKLAQDVDTETAHEDSTVQAGSTNSQKNEQNTTDE